jgi:hypothetical protein
MTLEPMAGRPEKSGAFVAYVAGRIGPVVARWNSRDQRWAVDSRPVTVKAYLGPEPLPERIA